VAGGLSDEFLAAVAEPERFSALADLDSRLEALVAGAAAAWPSVILDASRFVRRLASLLPETVGLDGLRAPDLYLATACAAGDASALRAFETAILPGVSAALTRFRDDRDFRGEVLQQLRVHLFTPGDAHIEDYRGAGSLAAWVRVIALRMGFNLLKQQGKMVPVSDPTEPTLAAADAELDILRSRYQAEFRAALAEAFAGLAVETRRILRYYLVDGMNIGEIGALVGTSRATVGRRVVDARRALLDGVRAGLRRSLGDASSAELDSIVRLAGTRFDLTLSRVLATPGA
jgi:RNA polymerase sigma-70 factor (ECF subfamily)